MGRFRAVGLSVLAFMVLSVFGGAPASAAEGTAVVTGGPAGWTATQIGQHTFTLPGGRVFSCGMRTFTGTVVNGDKELTAAPTFDNCHVTVEKQTLPATVEPTECLYRFYDLTTVEGNKYASKAAIVCPSGQALHYRLYLSAANHESGTRVCEYTLGPQTELTGVYFIDNPNNTINIEFIEVSLLISKSFGTVGNCGLSTFVSKYNGSTVAAPAAGSTWDLDD